MPEPMSGARRAVYALGNPGFLLSERIVVNVAIYFYLPPPGRGLAPQVPEQVILGFLTVFGLVMLVGRMVDSLADPFVGHASDRSRSRWGRRRSFLIYGVAPMCVLPALIFWPPGEPGSMLNAVWIAVLVALYFVAFTVYVAPYLALIPEIAWSQRERVRLSRLLALAGFPAMVVFNLVWPLGLDAGRSAGLEPATALRLVVVVFSLLALGLALAPIFAVDESRFVRGSRSELSLGRAWMTTLANRPFLIYLGSQLLFVFGINLIQPSLPYYATVVLGRSEGFAAVLGAAMFAGIAVGFLGMDALVHRFGPKRVMLICVGVFGVALAALGLLDADVPGGPRDRANLVITLGALAFVGFPIVGFLILPHVLLSQLIDEDERRTGANRAAMFYGVQGFLTKWVYGASLWVLTLLMSRFGNSPEQPLGVLLIGPVAGIACLLSLFVLARYPQERVLAATLREP